jgi:hypothetical protein
MFEVVISTVSTGRVVRKLFDTRDEADRHIDRFFAPRRVGGRWVEKERSRFRVEVYRRELPVVKPLPRPADPAVAAVA